MQEDRYGQQADSGADGALGRTVAREWGVAFELRAAAAGTRMDVLYWCRKLSDNPPSESSEAPPATFVPVRIAADTDAIRLPQVRVYGNDAKERNCPLWSETAAVLRRLVRTEADDESIFRNARGPPLTRDGVAYIVRTCWP